VTTPAHEEISAPRYAIYFVPAATTTLYRFGASLLGYDCYSGKDIAFPDSTDRSNWPAIVREPRLYGFHATLKAPFRLAPSVDDKELAEACSDFGSDHPPVMVGALAVRELGSFIALVPTDPRSLLNKLADACVEAFDRFRAPLSQDERARRLGANLTSQQVKNVERWGYPYVFADFRFHMTLSGALKPAERAAALKLICENFEQKIGKEILTIDQIVIARQAHAAARFQVIHCASLGHSPYRPYANSF
jgi:putative phosphonate metabolism protein